MRFSPKSRRDSPATGALDGVGDHPMPPGARLKPNPGGGRLRRALRLVFNLAIVWLSLTALAAPLHLDRVTIGMALTYQPSFAYACLCLPLGMLLFWRRKWLRALVVVIAGTLLFATTGLGGGVKAAPDTGVRRLLAFNTAGNLAALPRLVELARSTNADFLLLQEVSAEGRKAIPEALPEYTWLQGDERLVFENPHKRVFTCFTGLRQSLLQGNVASASDAKVSVETAITGYRTHAIHARIDGKDLWLVNVHSTKAFRPDWRLLKQIIPGDNRAGDHRRESDRLSAWLDAHRGDAVVVAGDFNAPVGAHNLRLPGLTHGHDVAGSGVHRTFPAMFPLWAIDHTLGNARVRFSSYRTIDTGSSDHRAQLAEFWIE